MRGAILAAMLLLSACATAEPVAMEEETVAEAVDDSYEAQIERAANALLAADTSGNLPADVQASVESVDETESALFYKVQILTAKNRRREQDYILYGQCPATDIAACAEQIAAAARMLKE